MIIESGVTRRPGRPKSEEKAESILDAASHLFMTEGMERTSMDAIAQAAGVSKQTVYSHFRSKDDLFRACISSKVDEYGLAVARLPANASIDQKLAETGRRFLTLIRDPEVMKMFRLMIAEATAFPKVSNSFHESGPQATVEFVASIFHAHLAEEDAATAMQAAGDFVGLLKGEHFMALLLGTRDTISDEDIETQISEGVRKIHKLYALSDIPVR